ncbi:tetratricopeptide repeat protein [bacterium]
MMFERIKLSSFIEKFIVRIFPYFCCFLALAFYLRTYDSCQIKITTVHFGSVIFSGLFLIKLIQENRLLKFTRGYFTYIIPVILFLLSGLISYSLSPFQETSIEELIKRIMFISIFFVTAFNFDKKDRIERLLRWIIIAALISSLYGIVQWLGMDPFLWKGAFGDRIFSTFGNPNFFSAYLVWVAPILLVYFLLTHKPGYLFVFLISAFCIMQTKSKASWIGLCAGVVVFAMLSVSFLSHANKVKIKKIMVGFVLLTVIMSSLGVLYFITKRIDSVRFRVFTWQATWEMIRRPKFVKPIQSQILGTGIGTFKIVYPAYRMPQIFHIEGKHNTETDHPENEFLEVWYDEGFIGIGIFMWLLLTFYWVSFYKIRYLSLSLQSMFRKNMSQLQIKHLTMQHYLVGAVSGLTGLLVHNLMCVNMRFVSSGFFLWVLLGMIIALLRGITNLSPQSETKPAESYSGIKQTSKTLAVGKIFVIVVIFVSMFFLINYFLRFYTADMHHNKGIAYSKARRWDKAIEHYRTVIKKNPNFVMAHYFLGNVFNDRWDMTNKYNPAWGDKDNIERNDGARTLAKYADVRRLAPNYVQVHYQAGVIYMKLRNWEKAIEYFKKYQELDPVFPQTYFQMGWAYNKLGNIKESEEMFKKAIGQNPKFTEAYINLGNLYYMQKKLDSAIKLYLRGLEINPNNKKLYQNLIIVYFETKQFKEAFEMSKRLLLIDPNNAQAKKVIQILLEKRK